MRDDAARKRCWSFPSMTNQLLFYYDCVEIHKQDETSAVQSGSKYTVSLPDTCPSEVEYLAQSYGGVEVS
jgi:hypothetical protein